MYHRILEFMGFHSHGYYEDSDLHPLSLRLPQTPQNGLLALWNLCCFDHPLNQSLKFCGDHLIPLFSRHNSLTIPLFSAMINFSECDPHHLPELTWQTSDVALHLNCFCCFFSLFTSYFPGNIHLGPQTRTSCFGDMVALLGLILLPTSSSSLYSLPLLYQTFGHP